jgi:protein-L-isoaspartate O-methyltransferase
VLAALVAVAALGAVAATAAAHGVCKVESGYFCIWIESDSDSASRRTLMLDDISHSAIDLRDARYLGLPYTRVLAGAIRAGTGATDEFNVLHVGGGGFGLPRYLVAVRPRAFNKVIEIDPAVVDTARSDLALRTGPRLQAEVGDARVLVRREQPGRYDFVVGDAFASRSPPWHLTTTQFLRQVRRVLRPRGVYLMNVIDNGQRFVRAELATLQRVFPHVALLDLPGSSNHVLVAGRAPIDSAAIESASTTLGVPVTVVQGARLSRLIGNASVLDDDFAPVDQLLR